MIQIDSLISSLDKKVENFDIIVEDRRLLDLEKAGHENKELYQDIYSFKNQMNLGKSLEIR